MLYGTDRRDTTGMTPAELADEMEWRELEDAGNTCDDENAPYVWPASKRPGYHPPLRGYSMTPTKAEKEYWRQKPVTLQPNGLAAEYATLPVGAREITAGLSRDWREIVAKIQKLSRYGITFDLSPNAECVA